MNGVFFFLGIVCWVSVLSVLLFGSVCGIQSIILHLFYHLFYLFYLFYLYCLYILLPRNSGEFMDCDRATSGVASEVRVTKRLPIR